MRKPPWYREYRDVSIIPEKMAQATQILRDLNIDVWLIFVRETLLNRDPALDFILDGQVTWRSAFLITRSGQHIAIVGHFDARNVESMNVFSQVVDYHHGIREPLLTALEQLRPRKIAINYSTSDVAADGLTVGLYHNLLDYFENTDYASRLISAEPIIAALRGRKSPTEVELVKAAVDITEQLFDEVGRFAKAGMTQREIADFVHFQIESRGLDYAWERDYDPIVTCGPYSPYGHAAPSDVPLEKGHTLHIDLGIKQNDYCSDLQRMWYVLKDDETTAPPDVQHAFDTVYGAIKAGEAALRPGVPGWKVDAAARRYIVDNNYAEYMHAFGHLLGRSVHDGATVLAPRWERYAGICELPVEVGNIFTLELHVTLPERGIMSLEEDVLITEKGVLYLSTPQTELRYIHP